MNWLKSLLLSWILIMPLALKAQDRQIDNPWALKLQYVGEFVLHPGFTVGTDYSLHNNNWFTLHWDTELGGFIHKRNNNSLFLQSTVGTRFTTRFAGFADIQVGLGYMLSMPNGDVYRVDDTGNIEMGGRPVSSHLKPTFIILFGWDGKRNRNIPINIFTGIEAYLQSAYNHIMLPHAALRLGVSYKL